MFFIVIIRTIVDYIYTDAFPEQIRPSFFDVDNYTNGLLIDEFFMHIVTFILSIFLYLYERKQLIKNKQKSLVFIPKISITVNVKNMYENNKMNTIGLTIFICFLSIVAAEIVLIIINLNVLELVFWVFDLFLIGNINHIIFGMPLHSHKKFAIAFILIFSGFFQLFNRLGKFA